MFRTKWRDEKLAINFTTEWRARREQLFRTFAAHVATRYAELTRKNHSDCKSEPCTRETERTCDQRRV